MRLLLMTSCLALAAGACTSTVASSNGRKPGSPSSTGPSASSGTGGSRNVDPGATGSGANGNTGTGSTSGSGGSTVGTGTPVAPVEAFKCDPAAAAEPTPPRRLWRVTPSEYGNTIAAAVNGRPAPNRAVAEVPGFVNPLLAPASARYTTESGVVGVSAPEFSGSFTASQGTAEQMVASAKNGTCWATDSAGANFAACVSTLVQDKGSILFRRPLAADEIAHYVDQANNVLSELGPDGALAVAFQSLLLAPQFVFKPEIGAATATPSVYRLTPFEVASMLSYTVTSAPADTDLWTAASQGALSTPDQIKAQVTRLMAGPQASGASNFVTEYFKLRTIRGVAKTADMVLAGESPVCHYNKERAISQAEALVGDIYNSNATSGFISTLFTTNLAYADCATEKIWGLSGSAQNDASPPTKMTAPAGQRAGFLTNPALMGGLAARDVTKPIKRGLFMNMEVLCTALTQVVPEGVPPLGDISALTMREALAAHAAPNASCKVCHDLLDPAGLAFENYDEIGTYRTMDKNKPIDASGTLRDTGLMDLDVDGNKISFTNAVDLSTQLASTNRVEQCVMLNGFRYFLGRREVKFDQCSLKHAQDAYQPGGSYVEFVASLASSDSFLNRSF